MSVTRIRYVRARALCVAAHVCAANGLVPTPAADVEMHEMLDAGLLDELLLLLHADSLRGDQCVLRHSCRTLANICAGSNEALAAVFAINSHVSPFLVWSPSCAKGRCSTPPQANHAAVKPQQTRLTPTGRFFPLISAIIKRGTPLLTHSLCLRVRVEIMVPGKYEIVGKSQSVLMMINPIISTRTHG
jgi:hypothetical protein